MMRTDQELEEDEPHFLLLDRFRNIVGQQDEDEYTMKIVLIQTTSIEDSKEICDNLLDDNVVVINMVRASMDQQTRIIDFISGVIYSVNGSIASVSNDIYIVAPYEIEIFDGSP